MKLLKPVWYRTGTKRLFTRVRVEEERLTTSYQSELPETVLYENLNPNARVSLQLSSTFYPGIPARGAGYCYFNTDQSGKEWRGMNVGGWGSHHHAMQDFCQVVVEALPGLHLTVEQVGDTFEIYSDE